MSYASTEAKESNPDGYQGSEAQKKRAEAICKKQTVFEGERGTTENTWGECFKYIIPSKGDVQTESQPGQKFGHELFDETAIQSNILLAANLHGNLTNPSAQFIDFFTGDPELDEDEEVKKWCQTVGDRMFLVMTASNFQTEIHEVYLELGAIGTAALYMGDDKDSLVHFSARAMKECYVDENNLGRIDTLHRKFKWRLRQIVQEFGEDVLTDTLKRQYRDGNEEPREILHATDPMTEEYATEQSKAQKWKFASCYLMKDDKLFLSEKGYRTFPYAVPRWSKKPGEKYGRGPGQSMLPTIKLVNVQEETVLQGTQLRAAPPMGAYDDSVLGKVKLTPFGITVVRRRSGEEFPIQPLFTGADVNFGFEAVSSARQRIMAGFFVNQFQLPKGGANRTAEEVNTITQQNYRLMGPVLGRLDFELLQPIVECLYDKMERAELIPPLPKKLIEHVKKGKKIQSRFSSMIARAQRMGEGENILRGISAAAPIVNAKPETLDLINGDKALEHILFDLYGLPWKIHNDARTIQQLREARQAAQERLAKEKAEQHQADVMSKMGPGAAQLIQAGGQQQ